MNAGSLVATLIAVLVAVGASMLAIFVARKRWDEDKASRRKYGLF